MPLLFMTLCLASCSKEEEKEYTCTCDIVEGGNTFEDSSLHGYRGTRSEAESFCKDVEKYDTSLRNCSLD